MLNTIPMKRGSKNIPKINTKLTDLLSYFSTNNTGADKNANGRAYIMIVRIKFIMELQSKLQQEGSMRPDTLR